MVVDRRDRITVDLRGAGQRIHACAAADGLTVAAFARRALLAGLDKASETGSGAGPADGDGGVLKVTIRLPAAHAWLLARRARAADLSQGNYVAALLEDAPPVSASSDRHNALTALVRSTDQLAILSTDLNAMMRLIRQADAVPLEPYRSRIQSLDADVRGHLALASGVLAQMPRSTSARSGGKLAGLRR